MQILQRTNKRWLVIVLIAIFVGCICVGFYLRALRRPIPPLFEIADKSADFYFPVHHTLSPARKAHVLDGNFLIVKSVDRLPNDLKIAFSHLSGMHNFEMANPEEKYQSTDVVVEHGLPWRRLIFAGISPGKYFIHYEEGGIGHSFHVAVFTIGSKQEVTFFWGGPGFRGAQDLEQLRTMIAGGTYADDQSYSW